MNISSAEIKQFKQHRVWVEFIAVIDERIAMVVNQLKKAPPQTMRKLDDSGDVIVHLGVEPLQAEIDTLENVKLIIDRLEIEATEEEEENEQED